MPAAKDIVRIAAIGDLHYGRTAAPGSLQPLFARSASRPTSSCSAAT